MNDLEIRENEIEEVEMDETTEKGKGFIGKVLIVVGLAAVAGVAAFAYKNRKKLEEKRIQKLEKKGYIVSKPETTDEDEEE